MILDIWNWKAALTLVGGEMYGFFDWENFYNDRHDKPGSEQRYTFKKYQPYLPWVTPDLISTCMRMAPTVLRIA